MLQAAGGGVFFTTKELKAFSQSYREARAEYNESQQDLVRNIQQVRNNNQSPPKSRKFGPFWGPIRAIFGDV